MKLKIDLRSGTKLSEKYSNTPHNYKIVEVDNVLGYSVTSGGSGAVAAVRPIYRADLHMKVRKIWHIISSYEMGDRLNDYTFYEDPEGCAFAMIASQALSGLVLHNAKLVKASVKTQRSRSRRSVHKKSA